MSESCLECSVSLILEDEVNGTAGPLVNTTPTPFFIGGLFRIFAIGCQSCLTAF